MGSVKTPQVSAKSCSAFLGIHVMCYPIYRVFVNVSPPSCLIIRKLKSSHMHCVVTLLVFLERCHGCEVCVWWMYHDLFWTLISIFWPFVLNNEQSKCILMTKDKVHWLKQTNVNNSTPSVPFWHPYSFSVVLTKLCGNFFKTIK